MKSIKDQEQVKEKVTREAKNEKNCNNSKITKKSKNLVFEKISKKALTLLFKLA